MAYIIPGYRLTSKIGQGAMATVWRAVHEITGQVRAIKIPDSGYSKERKSQEAFFKEARRVLQLGQHPNIVYVHDINLGADDSPQSAYYNNQVPYIVMDLIDGVPLSQLLVDPQTQQPRLFPPDVIIRIAYQICQALHHAHESPLKLIHRDVKPGNILVTTDYRAFLVDFGIAIAVEGTRAAGGGGTFAQFGTWQYMPWEQFEAKVVPQSDLYALSCVMYEMATGRRPFEPNDGKDDYEWYKSQHKTQPPIPPGTLNPRLPVGLEAIILKGLTKKTEGRFASARQMLTDLEKAAKSPGRAPVSFRSLPCIECGQTQATTEHRRCSTCSGGPPPPQPVDVRVVTLPHALVELRDQKGNHIATQAADANGQCQFPTLRPREPYTAVVTPRAGYQPGTRRFVPAKSKLVAVKVRPVKRTRRGPQRVMTVIVTAGIAVCAIAFFMVRLIAGTSEPPGGGGGGSVNMTQGVSTSQTPLPREPESKAPMPPEPSPEATISIRTNRPGATIAYWTTNENSKVYTQIGATENSLNLKLKEVNEQLRNNRQDEVDARHELRTKAAKDGGESSVGTWTVGMSEVVNLELPLPSTTLVKPRHRQRPPTRPRRPPKRHTHPPKPPIVKPQPPIGGGAGLCAQ